MLTRRQILAALFAVPAVKLLPAVPDFATGGPVPHSGPAILDTADRLSRAAMRALRIAQSVIDTAEAVRVCYPTDKATPVTPEHHRATFAACIQGGGADGLCIAAEPPVSVESGPVVGRRVDVYLRDTFRRNGPIARMARRMA